MYRYKAFVKRVVDGDTFDIKVDLGFHTTVEHRFRLIGVDTPETFRPKSEGELRHGLKATAFVKTLIENNHVILRSEKKIGIYGRWNAHIEIEGKDLAQLIRDNDLEKRMAYD